MMTSIGINDIWIYSCSNSCQNFFLKNDRKGQSVKYRFKTVDENTSDLMNLIQIAGLDKTLLNGESAATLFTCILKVFILEFLSYPSSMNITSTSYIIRPCEIVMFCRNL